MLPDPSLSYAVIDEEGLITDVERNWRILARSVGLKLANDGVGVSYGSKATKPSGRPSLVSSQTLYTATQGCPGLSTKG